MAFLMSSSRAVFESNRLLELKNISNTFKHAKCRDLHCLGMSPQSSSKTFLRNSILFSLSIFLTYSIDSSISAFGLSLRQSKTILFFPSSCSFCCYPYNKNDLRRSFHQGIPNNHEEIKRKTKRPAVYTIFEYMKVFAMNNYKNLPGNFQCHSTVVHSP